MTSKKKGGFFAFVCLLVLYKTKCKPMWKNRRKRLTNTPATQSMADSYQQHQQYVPSIPAFVGIVEEDEQIRELDECAAVPSDEAVNNGLPNSIVDEEGMEYECIPLRPIMHTLPSTKLEGAGDDQVDKEIFFLDIFGNYIIPISSSISPGASRPAASNDCSCHTFLGNTEEYGLKVALKRRQSQVMPIVILLETNKPYTVHVFLG